MKSDCSDQCVKVPVDLRITVSVYLPLPFTKYINEALRTIWDMLHPWEGTRLFNSENNSQSVKSPYSQRTKTAAMHFFYYLSWRCNSKMGACIVIFPLMMKKLTLIWYGSSLFCVILFSFQKFIQFRNFCWLMNNAMNTACCPFQDKFGIMTISSWINIETCIDADCMRAWFVNGRPRWVLMTTWISYY